MPERTTSATARRRAVAVVSVLLLSVGLLTSPAAGHASGQVPQARLGAAGRTVTLEWTAAADDVADLAVAAGIWAEEVAAAYLDVAFGGATDRLPSDAEVAAMGRDRALRRYLEDRVRIVQDGTACAGSARPADDPMTDGVTFTFECPVPVTAAVVEIRLLHDRDPAYRTFSVDGTRQYAVHTASRPAHPWDFRPAQLGSGRVPVTPVLLGAALIALVGALLLQRLWSPGGAGAPPGRAGPDAARR